MAKSCRALEAMAVKKKWVRWAILGVAAALLVALLLLLAPWSWEKLDIDKLTQLKQTSILYDADGERVGSLYGSEHRVYVTLEKIPLHVQQAFLAAEDQRFYEHPGVDIVRLFGALWHDIRTMSLEQGASTITQQLIKLTHLSGEKTLSRKAQEAVLALQLERQIDKDDILERYLNVVNFGRGAYGVEAAANAYFGKHVGELTLAEGALLAGVIKSPSNYAPHLEPENAVERRDLILQEMVDCGFITGTEAENAQKEALVLDLSEESAQYGWYLDAAATEAQSILDISRDELLAGGYAIYTALDPQAQAAAEELFANGANFPDPAADGTPAQAALVAENVENGEIVALVGGRTYDVRLGLNRATQIRRQPGSAIKPVSAYAAALEGYGYLPTSFVDDTPRVFAGGYQPGNAGGEGRRGRAARAIGTLWDLAGGEGRRPRPRAWFDDGRRLPRPPLRRILRPRQRRASRGTAYGAQDRLKRRPRPLRSAADGRACRVRGDRVHAHGHAAHRRRRGQRQRPQRRGDECGRQDGHRGHEKRRQPRRLDGGLHAEAGRGCVDGL